MRLTVRSPRPYLFVASGGPRRRREGQLAVEPWAARHLDHRRQVQRGGAGRCGEVPSTSRQGLAVAVECQEVGRGGLLLVPPLALELVPLIQALHVVQAELGVGGEVEICHQPVHARPKRGVPIRSLTEPAGHLPIVTRHLALGDGVHVERTEVLGGVTAYVLCSRPRPRSRGVVHPLKLHAPPHRLRITPSLRIAGRLAAEECTWLNRTGPLELLHVQKAFVLPQSHGLCHEVQALILFLLLSLPLLCRQQLPILRLCRGAAGRHPRSPAPLRARGRPLCSDGRQPSRH
mmetsp:Transcript_102932/g.321969  ORF Transcript_102932/g.321969 Transcript_102932/m.321969 type:complete len:290 (+) Transcript_102932:42-911(+)